MRASYYAYTMVLFSTALLEIVSRAALGGSDHRSGGANAIDRLFQNTNLDIYLSHADWYRVKKGN